MPGPTAASTRTSRPSARAGARPHPAAIPAAPCETTSPWSARWRAERRSRRAVRRDRRTRPVDIGRLRLALPASRHARSEGFSRAGDRHRSAAAGRPAFAARSKARRQLAKAGVRVARQSPLMPDIADSSRLYMRLLMSFSRRILPARGLRGRAGRAPPSSEGRRPARRRAARGMVLSHRDWLFADRARAAAARRNGARCSGVRRGDLPDHADAGLPARHSPDQDPPHRRSTARTTSIPISWCGPASPPCPACRRPRSRSGSRARACRSACRSSAPGWRTARHLKLAELIEREFGGFVPPPMFDD